MKQAAGSGHAKKHAGTRKHAGTAKHHPAGKSTHHTPAKAQHAKTAHTVAKHPAHAKARGLPLAAGLACCSALAVAASLRAAGGAVDDDAIEALYWATASNPDAGASIWATLVTASERGLGGYRPVRFRPAGDRGRHASHLPAVLGLELPGPHAVFDDGRRWWSWGLPWPRWPFPRARVEEAWEVTWS